MMYEDAGLLAEQIAAQGFKDVNGHLLENNFCYMELKDIIARQKEREKAFKEIIGLLNSMVLSGEKHTEQSQSMVERALKLSPSNEEIWKMATRILIKELIQKTALGKCNPEETEELLRGLPVYYFKRAIVEIERSYSGVIAL